MSCLRQGIFLFLAMLLMFSGIAYAQEEVSVRTVRVIGTAEILNKNIAAAKEQAISACLISAVNTSAVEIFAAEDIVHNFSKICKMLYDDAGKFIRDYKILAEFRTEKTYRIMLEATVISDRIKSLEAQLEKVSVQKLPEAEKSEELPPEYPDSEEMKPSETSPEYGDDEETKPSETFPAYSVKAMPSVLFLLAEQNLEKDSFQYWWGGQAASLPSFSETAIGEIMRQKGFSIVNHGYRASDGKEKSDLAYPPDLDNREAVNMGSRLSAGVVIVGKSVVYKVSGAGEGVSFSSTVSARALRTDTGEEIAASFQTAVKTGANEIEGSKNALSAAGALAGEDLSLQIAKIWQKKASARLSENVTEAARSDTAFDAKLPADVGVEKSASENAFGTPISEPPIAYTPLIESNVPTAATDRPDALLYQKPETIQMIVRGTRDLGNFMNFRRTLTDIPGVKAIQTLEMKADEATIGVNFDGNTASLADTLAVKIFELFYMKVYKVSENSMTIDLIPK